MPSGSYTLPLLDSNKEEQKGQVEFETRQGCGCQFWGDDPLRIGFVDGCGWGMPADGMVVEDLQDPGLIWIRICYTNTSGVPATDPIVLTADLDGSVKTWEFTDPALLPGQRHAISGDRLPAVALTPPALPP